MCVRIALITSEPHELRSLKRAKPRPLPWRHSAHTSVPNKNLDLDTADLNTLAANANLTCGEACQILFDTYLSQPQESQQ